MPTTSAVVAIVEDDAAMRRSIERVLRASGYTTLAFASAEEFLAFDCFEQTSCLIVDIAMPGMTGPEL